MSQDEDERKRLNEDAKRSFIKFAIVSAVVLAVAVGLVLYLITDFAESLR